MTRAQLLGRAGAARFRRFVAGAGLAAALTLCGYAVTAETVKLVPPPAADAAPASERMQSLVLAGGCFWGVQAVFQHVNGVATAISGYAGGAKDTADYETVSSGRTGHAESVRIVYDPKVVSAGQLLQVFFSVAHDPTQRNRQGPDTGTQYRSAVFYADDAQKTLAQAYIAQLDAAGAFSRPIATEVTPLKGFYPAEAYHQDYLVLHPESSYIAYNDQPKVEALKRLFPALYRDKPRLVSEARGPF